MPFQILSDIDRGFPEILFAGHSEPPTRTTIATKCHNACHKEQKQAGHLLDYFILLHAKNRMEERLTQTWLNMEESSSSTVPSSS